MKSRLMHVQRHAGESRETGRVMPVIEYGTTGPPLVYVPSSGGDETEFERYGLPAVCSAWIRAGRVRIFSIDGCGPRTFWNDALSPPERIRAYAAFERYAATELLPWVAARSHCWQIGVVGPSYGAHVAANLLFKYPQRVQVACGLGGVYGLWHRLDGHHDRDVYLHTPLEYLPGLEDLAALGAIRSTAGIALFGAEKDEWLPSTRRLQSVLSAKELPHTLDVWPSPADHHERWWSRQIPRFLARYY